MASSETEPAPCLMCLDVPAVRTVDVCQHSFCETCLKSYQEDNGSKSCPACKGQCRQTDTQAKVDDEDGETNGQTVETADTDGNGSEDDTLETNDDEVLPKSLKCIICLCRGIEVRAAKVCVDCKDIPMCTNCLQDHRQCKWTKNHVHSLLSNKSASYSGRQDCVPHGRQLDIYCKACTTDICCVCLSLEHHDHDIEPLADIMRSHVGGLQTALEYEEGRLVTLESDEAYLKEAKSTAEDMESNLIKSIEDHTETVIEQAITNKETLKKEVRISFKMIGVFAKCLAAMPELVKASNEVIARADRVLHDKAELSSVYVEKLRCLEQDLKDLEKGGDDYNKEKGTYKTAYENLCERPMVFYPRSPNMDIGGFDNPGPKCDAGGSCVCETCQKKVAKLPDKNRVDECRTKKTCTCGTCGSVFHHSKLYKRTVLEYGFVSCSNGYCRHDKCGSKIASSYYI